MNKYSTKFCIRLILAFVVLYVFWGANYLAISFAVAEIPPFILAGTRFLTAGVLIYAWCVLSGEKRPAPRQWLPATKLGLLLNVGGTGSLIWSQQYIPSGLASILITTVPLWMVVMDRGNWPLYTMKSSVVVGLLLGLAGVLLLSGFQDVGSNNTAPGFYMGIIILILGTVAWAGGSLYARKINPSVSLLMNLAMQMTSAGIILLLISIVSGEWFSFAIESISLKAYLAFLHIVVMASIAGYIAYIWLLQVKPPAVVATYAYVNPVIAVILGWLLANETVNNQTILSLFIILLGVFIVSFPSIPRILYRFIQRYFTFFYKYKRRPDMIARTWHGIVPREKGDAYYTYLKKTGLPDYTAIAGNRGVQVLRKDEEEKTHFFLITFWDSVEAIKKFAGDNYQKSRYYDEDKEYLLEFEPCADHYEVVEKV